MNETVFVFPAMNRLFCSLCFAAIALLLVGGNTGCSRQHYRMKADREVYSILREGNNDPRWRIDDYRIAPDPTSRMFDAFHPDWEPMPTDDPAAHQKMHWAAGMKGSHHWHDNGCTQTVENPRWRQYLLLNEKGEIPLDRNKALELSRLHSPRYQAALENLYRTAMAVALERFEYDVQFFGAGSVSYTDSSKKLVNDANFGAKKALAAGTTWVVDLANTVTWTLTGQSSWSMESLINVGLTQPLLRGASRKVVLENLTQAERDFLAAVRRMVLFQQGHYVGIVVGSPPQYSEAPSTNGFYNLLSEQIQIQNQRQNVIGLEENLNRLIEMFDANQGSDVTQIEEMRQNLFSSQSDLLGQINSYQSNVESYIHSLGLPPDLKVSISDPLLEQFQLTSPELTVLMGDVADLLMMIRKMDEPLPENFRERTKDAIRRAKGEIIVLSHDLDILQKSMPERIGSLRNLESALAERIENGERIDPRIYDTGVFEDRIAKLRTKDIPQNLTRLQALFTILEEFSSTEEQELREMIQNHAFSEPVKDALKTLDLNETTGLSAGSLPQQQNWDIGSDSLEKMRGLMSLESTSEQDRQEIQKKIRRIESRIIIAELQRKDEYRDWTRRVFSMFQYELITLSLMQTRTKLDSMTLIPVSITAEEAFLAASEHRLDWMNKKANLVDDWRQMDIAADKLKGVLDLELKGTAGRVDSRGGFRDSSHLQASLKWDSPLNRYAEMMAYRNSQIDYQAARRAYYTYVDTVQADLRKVVRDLQMSRINFEINRNAVFIGTVRVDVMQLRMDQPPQRGGKIDTDTARQLINALEGLLRSQNNLLTTWVGYQKHRMLLDMHMGTMKLDDRGCWIEPDVMESTVPSIPTLAPEVVPLPLPVPVLEIPRLNRRYVEE